jgi:Asp-tRNA(Asn)/Glu-tRNA(Gln) amidotransferase A subunit family amidase
MAKTPGQANHSLPEIDIHTATAADLQQLLSEGRVKSTDLVDLYLHQIESHNHRGLHFNAMISTTPQNIPLAIAETLGKERAAGKFRGPLHGIPVSVKVLQSHRRPIMSL